MLKYYITNAGCFGWVGGRYELFVNEEEYFEYCREAELEAESA